MTQTELFNRCSYIQLRAGRAPEVGVGCSLWDELCQKAKSDTNIKVNGESIHYLDAEIRLDHAI